MVCIDHPTILGTTKPSDCLTVETDRMPMTPKEIAILIALTIAMLAVALSMGKWVEASYPDKFQLHEPTSPNSSNNANTDNAPSNKTTTAKESTAFGYGAATGLLIISLLYCLLAAALLLRCKATNRPRSPLITAIAILAAVGFSLSYFVDGYFF